MTNKKALKAAGNGPATQQDLRTLGRGLRNEIAAGRKDLTAVEQRLDGRIDALRQDLSDLGQRLDAKIDATAKRLAIEIVTLQANGQRIESTMVTKDEFRQGLAVMTAIASRSDQEHKATLIHGQVLTEVQAELKDHEGRIHTLEAKAGL